MQWAFKWRDQIQTGQYYDLLARGGFLKPEDHEPEISGLDFYFDAFRELSSCRPGGFSLQAIPFTAIVEYSRIYEIGDFDDFMYFMRLLDSEYLDLSAKAEKKPKPAGNNATSNANAKNNNSN